MGKTRIASPYSNSTRIKPTLPLHSTHGECCQPRNIIDILDASRADINGHEHDYSMALNESFKALYGRPMFR